jgi:cell division septal protein FtsQ
MRWRRVLILVAGMSVAASPWWGRVVLRRFRFFEVRRIEVVGTRYLAPAAIVAALGLRRGESVWSDVGAMERRVRSLGGIESVTVSRRLPATLRVVVVEVEPVALAQGPSGLVAVARDGRPLPYDPATAPVDAPVVERAEASLVAALALVQATELGLFADITAARPSDGAGGEVVLELEAGRLRLATPVDPAVVHAMVAVRRDLKARGQSWRELDGRFRGWVVVRGAGVRGARGAARPASRAKVA